MIADKLNFTIKGGELVAIVGVNGIGKSTLMRTLGRIQPELDGKVILDEKSISE
ncbi:MAG: ATP-binding cassette domain-containing protein, partial [Eudoraea sp.]|nr:ATP-binding cassette domain-containing protein [Eudoraea sp.]